MESTTDIAASNAERYIFASLFRNRFTGNRLRYCRTEEYFADEIRNAPVFHGAKTELPLISFATFGKLGTRSISNVLAVHAMGLDFDTPVADPAPLAARIASILQVGVHAHSTMSSESQAYRLRIIVPYSEPVTAGEHALSIELVHRRLADRCIAVDASCTDASRGFYVPRRPANGAFWSDWIRGPRWPARRVAAAWSERRDSTAGMGKPAARSNGDSGVVSIDAERSTRRARAWLAATPGAVSGMGGHAATFVVAMKLVRGFALPEATALRLIRDWNKRCAPPWSDAELLYKLQSAAASSRMPMGEMLASGAP